MAKEKTGQDDGGLKDDKGQTTDGQKDKPDNNQEISNLAEKLDNMHTTMTKWSNEIGDIRKSDEVLNSLADRFTAIEEKLSSSGNDGDDVEEYNPYSKKEREIEILGIIDKSKPDNGDEKYITKDDMNNMLSLANKNSIVTKEFKLTEEEMAEVISESTESGLSVREVAFDKFAKRKFETQDYLEKLSKELQNNDTMEPLDSSSETVFDKTGIPSDPKEFKKWYDEKEKASPGSARLAMLEPNKVET